MAKAERRLQIEICKEGFRPFELDKEEKQRLTIHDNGKVWFTTYGLKTEMCWQYKAIRKERYRITAAEANSIIDKALTLINDDNVQDAVFVMECDTTPDIITIVDTKGHYYSKRVYHSSVQAAQDLYAELRTLLKVDMLLEFDYEYFRE